MAFDFKYPTPLPSTKGWGPGWPNCQRDKIVPHPIFQGGVHRDILELVNLLVAELERRGYRFREGWSWGFGCRATKGGDGDVPSFHSWGLALDFNAPINPFGAPTHNMPRWVVDLMREYGFFWLGPSIRDWMHFHFCGSPADARAMTEKARKELGEDMADQELREGVRAFLRGEEPAREGAARAIYRALKKAASTSEPVPPNEVPPHEHDVTGKAA